MTSSSSKKVSWISLCSWLWAKLKLLWGAIISAVVINLVSNWLTLPSGQLDLSRTPIGWLLKHLSITLLLGGSLIVLSIITGLVAKKQRRTTGQNRDHFLGLLRLNYNDRLRQSLPENVPSIELSFHSEPDLVQSRIRQTRPPGTATSILQVYNEANGELLILGEPGAGKTTMLLQLARDLRDRAEHDPQKPLPVVVNLSTWADPHGFFGDWLIKEVARMYDVPVPILTNLIDNNQLLPLLDGLDEVPDATRLTCIKAINTYKQNYFGPLVVCCRTTEYRAQQSKLKLQDAVIVQPLEERQIDAYFQNTGCALNSARDAYQSLRDLVKTPLMLYMLIVSKDKDIMLLPSEGTQPVLTPPKRNFGRIRLIPVEEQQKTLQEQQKLLRDYLANRLEKYDEDFHISSEQVKRQLTWLAQHMKQRNLKTFHIEHIQPDWLQDTQTYERYAVQSPDILIGMSLSLLVNALLFNSFDPVRFIVYAFIGGHIGNLLSRVHVERQAAGRQVRLPIVKSLGSSFLIGLGVLLSIWSTVGQAYTISDWLHNGLATGLCSAISSFLLSLLFQRGYNRPNLPLLSASDTSWRKIWEELTRAGYLRNGALVGLCVGLTFSLGTGLAFLQQDGLVYGMTFGIRDGLTYGLTFGLIGILLSIILVGNDMKIHPTEILTWSWSSLWQSLLRREHRRHALLFGTSVGLGIGMSLGLSTLASQWLGGRSFGLNIGLVIGLGTSLGDGLAYGLTFGIAYWLLVGLFRGLSSNYLPPDRRIKPNEGIWRSARLSLWAGLSSGIVSGLIGILCMMLYFGLHTGLGQGLNIGLNLGWQTGVSNALHIGLDNGLIAGLQVGLFGGLLVCALMGGLACLRHSVLRLLLQQSYNIPFNYPRFLDRAARCILLHKVGGGYEFFHDLLLEHLLSQETEISHRNSPML